MSESGAQTSPNAYGKVQYGKLFLIGFGFFSVSIAWSVYNSFVPLMLVSMGFSRFLGGLIMSIDNVCGVIFQPIFGALSDRTRSRFGRRMPYILLGIPLCAALFMLLPLGFAHSLPLMMTILIVFNVIMAMWRSPVVALMPDVTPPPQRSMANGVINLMGGVGNVIAALVGGGLSKVYGTPAPFIVSACVMMVSWLLLLLFVREPAEATRAEPAKETRASREERKKLGFRMLSADEKRSLLRILCAIFFWFLGFNAVETWFTAFAFNTFGMLEGDAVMMLAFFSVPFVAFALPAGLLGGKFGRKPTILAGLIGVGAIFFALIFVRAELPFRVLLIVGGLFWACVNINSLPMVVELAGASSVGTFTGYYYFFSVMASVVAPSLSGLIRDLTHSDASLFVFATASFVIALAFMVFVRHGDRRKVTVREAIEQMDD